MKKMFNIKIVWFIIMHDVQQKLSTFLIMHFTTKARIHQRQLKLTVG
jgi:hypothetical protein